VGGASDRNARTAPACAQNGHAIHSAGDSGRAGATGASQRGQASVPAASWFERARYRTSRGPELLGSGSSRGA
jgi:hypothetical protein